MTLLKEKIVWNLKRRIKCKNMFHAQIKGRLKCHLELTAKKLHKSYGNNWVASKSKRNTSVQNIPMEIITK